MLKSSCFLQVKFEDILSGIPGMYQVQVVVGMDSFGPRRSSKKKLARKLAAIQALKELINWEPKEGKCDILREWLVNDIVLQCKSTAQGEDLADSNIQVNLFSVHITQKFLKTQSLSSNDMNSIIRKLSFSAFI